MRKRRLLGLVWELRAVQSMSLSSERPSFGDLQTSLVDFSVKDYSGLRWVEADKKAINR